MERFLEVAGALFLLLFVHWGFHAASRRLGRGVGRGVRKLVRPGLRNFLTIYYRRKAIAQAEEQRKKTGIPPLENSHLD